MQARSSRPETGSTLVVVLSVTATILVLLGAAMEYTTHVSRLTQRTRKTALAVEIADGHLEYLFSNWRNISRMQVTQATKKSISVVSTALPTNYFFTASYNPGPAATGYTAIGLTAAPPVIALPNKSLFPTEKNYTVTQYRIQAVDPMITLDGNENALSSAGTVDPSATPPAAFGPNTSATNGQYSYYYLAAVDVTVPALTGNVTAKVRRVFEKKYEEPFTFALFYHDDLELQPSNPLTITGPIQTNGSLYIGTSNFTAQTPSATFPTSGKVGFSNMYVNGASPKDPLHISFSQPNTPDLEPPMMQPAYLPYGWNLNLNGGANNESYHELIEQPVAGADPIAGVRFYNQATYHVLLTSSAAPNNIMVYDNTGATVAKNNGDGKVINDALTNGSGLIDQSIIQDVREGGPILVTTVDIGAVSSKSTLQMVYISDTTAGTSTTVSFNGNSYTTSKRALRIKNGATITPTTGLTIVSENPVYIQGDFNTGTSPPSNSGTYTSPTGSGYTRRPCAIVADAVSVLSNAWSDTTATASRVASNTTVNAALVTGIVPSDGVHYSGGGENFVRFLENWSGKSFTYYGSMIELWSSKQGTGTWSSSTSIYTMPSYNNWYYDTNLATTVPPGNWALAAYLQQQRWYQVY